MKELKLEDILQNTEELKEKRVGYIAIIGRPNAGKSTFINALIWEKIAITSNIPQTTRNKILAMYNDTDAQIIFVDTPGVHESNKVFNAEINHQALSSIRDVEMVLYFIDGSREKGQEETYLESLLENVPKPVMKIFTKSDLPRVQALPEKEKYFCISSKDESGFWDLLNYVKQQLPLGPMLFSEDMYTKQSIFFRVSEIIREKLFMELKEELPHSVFVSIEEVLDDERGMKRIIAYVYTETDSQKYIVIGKKGSLISRVGKEARLELEEIFDQKVFLQLRAKVRKNWRKDEGFIRKMLK